MSLRVPSSSFRIVRPWLPDLYPSSPDAAQVAQRATSPLPSFMKILRIYLFHKKEVEEKGILFLTNCSALHEVTFSPERPILGSGHHFVVYASPFDTGEDAFKLVRGVNMEVYCIKAPNFMSGNLPESGFRDEYYHTVLQELRVLLHPKLRSHENIISLLGLDFYEDYDAYRVAWPVLLMEYAAYGTLDIFQQDVNLEPQLVRLLLLDVAIGLHALHQCNIIHGDVKSENVLVCQHPQRKYVARLSDFGLSLINPAIDQSHRLPGGTFLWLAPEANQLLSVEGLKQTDVYSFGLTVWRVLVYPTDPYHLLQVGGLGFHSILDTNELVGRIKSRDDFRLLVMQTFSSGLAARIYPRGVVEATLGLDPASRDLTKAINLLSLGNSHPLPVRGQSNLDHWLSEADSNIITELTDAYPFEFIPLVFKPSVLHSFLNDLETATKSNSEHACAAGSLLFQFATSIEMPVTYRTTDECFQVLLRLCQLNSPNHQAIIFRYHEVYGGILSGLNEKWLEIAMLNGSLFAMQSIRSYNPGKYGQIKKSFESSDVFNDDDLLSFARSGNYARCIALLKNGASALSEDGAPSPLHWLVAFDNEDQIHDLANQLLLNGAVLDSWEGGDDNLLFGTVFGTPLHWAVWHRNVPAVRALTHADWQPEERNVNRAIVLASAMYFYDILEVLNDWILLLNHSSVYNWKAALIVATSNLEYYLPRILRHGKNLEQAFSRTIDLILAIYEPPPDDIIDLFGLSINFNNSLMLQYLFGYVGSVRGREILTTSKDDWAFRSMAGGYFEIFKILINQGLMTAQTEHGEAKYKPLQACCFSRQRNTAFVRTLLDIGCSPDEIGPAEKSGWTPFSVAVSSGLYDVAIILLERGADKDYLTGWLGGSTPAMRIMQAWPDVPISRLKFLFEELPRLGFGHVNFIGWPGAGGNLLYPVAMSPWTSYSGGYRLTATAKYVLSMLGDKSSLNKIDRIGSTALRMAAMGGNVEICQLLLEDGMDVNLSGGPSPLRDALDWLGKCKTREEVALNKGPGSERRLAKTLHRRAQETVDLLFAHGAIDRGMPGVMEINANLLSGSQWSRPSFETVLEILSGAVDKGPRVEPGSMPLQPTQRSQFRVHHGQKGKIQEAFAKLGRGIDSMIANGSRSDHFRAGNPVAPRYSPHNCWPWRICGYKDPPMVHHDRGISQPLLPAHNFFYDSPLINPPAPAPQINSSNYPIMSPHITAPQMTYNNYPINYSAKFQAQPVFPDPPISQTTDQLITGIQHSLLKYVCEGESTGSDEYQRKNHAVTVLEEQFRRPVLLDAPRYKIDECEEYYKIHQVIQRCLEVLTVRGVSLVPELAENGRELVVHVTVDHG